MSVSQPTTPIAIVGMSCIFPEAKDLSQYWNNIVHEVDCITDIPPSHWQIEDYYDPDPTVPDKTYSKRGGFIPEIDFDPTEFGLPPNILEVTDASQLLSLVVAKDALRDAKYGDDHRPFDRDRTGVILGVGGGQNLISPLASRLQEPIWRKVLHNSGLSDTDIDQIVPKIKAAYVPWEEDSFPGLLGNVIAGRIASRLDLGGTNCVVDAACAASLSAATMAVSDLVEGRSDMIITGGVDTDNSIFMYMCFSKTPALTPGTHARPFDANSDGILIGEGVGMLVLKRLEDAERDNDHIYAVIRGIGTSSDGRSKSIYAPREDGQVKALKRAHQNANIKSETIGLIEAHGTGTRAGDVCEVEALKEVFDSSKKQHIALGSVKSQIGHTKSAAGAAGLIKTALALQNKVLPPTLHIDTPNPKLELENSALYLNTQTRPWFQPSNQNPRRAGVSAFGFGGTNFHFVLEEYNKTENSKTHRTVPQTILLHANTLADLIAKCEQTHTNLQTEESTQFFTTLIETSKSTDIPATSPRVGFVTQSETEAAALLEATITGLKSLQNEATWEHPKGIFYRNSALPQDKKVVALFPGQGSQYLNMGCELAINHPVIRQTWETVNTLSETPLTEIVFPTPAFSEETKSAQTQALQNTANAQPAIGTFSTALYKLLQSTGFQPDFVAGHSFGEITALWAAGVFTDADFFALAKTRGSAMAPADDPDFDPGTMLAVKTSASEIQTIIADIPDLTLANDNADNQVVVAGSTDSIKSAQQKLEAQNISSILLPVSGAFHTPLVAHAQEPFSQALKKITFHKQKTPIYSNTTTEPFPTHPQSARKLVREHMLKPVRFREQIEQIYADGGHIFVEVGPRNVLTKLVDQTLNNKPHLCIALNSSPDRDSDLQLRQALLQLRIAGLPLTDLEPQATETSAPKRKNKMTVRLNGNNYVSEKTLKGFEQALENGHRTQITKPNTPAPPQEQPSVPAPEIPVPKPQHQTQHQPHHLTQGQTMSNQPPELRQQMIESLERSLAQFYSLQAETLRVHEQYLNGQMEYARTFFQLIQQQYALLGAQPIPQNTNHQPAAPPAPPAPVAPQTHIMPQPQLIPQPPPQPQPVQTPPPAPVVPPAPPVSFDLSSMPATPPAHTNGAGQNHQMPVPQQPVVNTPIQPTAPEPTPAPSQPAGNLDEETLTKSMLAIVSDKTGYPEDVIDLDMDIEADLGIDSIKRVEILGAMLDTHPDLPQVNPEDLAELNTLAQIVGHMKQQMPA